MSTPNQPNTLSAFTRGRLEVDHYVSESARQGRTWNEESATERLIMAACPEVRYVEFNRVQEDIIGADWLWWFVDESGECIGTLIQAKRLKIGVNSFSVDFKHPGGSETGKQMADLLAASNILKVPAVYAVYCGDREYRGGNRMCPAPGNGGQCQRCERASVLLLPGLAAQELLDRTPSDAGESTFREGVPLEDIVDPAVHVAHVEDYYRLLLGDDFAEFMEKPQAGARGIAKALFKIIKDIRDSPLVKFSKTWMNLGPDAVFRDVFAGGDQEGSPLLPYEHILRGLRRQLPKYVEDVIGGGHPPREYLPYLAGMIVVNLESHSA